ncbi:programmed cell death protein 7-like [Penaeus chinensis]|uniref:programmed cell death protein 7-like n=1 Tax=Penaeus chinensis TaxID=139456 RepID=UPI001FB5C1DB|nr:programmed cell death protein 7-like [Penaeus chinensis]
MLSTANLKPALIITEKQILPPDAPHGYVNRKGKKQARLGDSDAIPCGRPIRPSALPPDHTLALAYAKAGPKVPIRRPRRRLQPRAASTATCSPERAGELGRLRPPPRMPPRHPPPRSSPRPPTRASPRPPSTHAGASSTPSVSSGALRRETGASGGSCRAHGCGRRPITPAFRPLPQFCPRARVAARITPQWPPSCSVSLFGLRKQTPSLVQGWGQGQGYHFLL